MSQYRWAIVSELEPEPEPDFATILAAFEGFDLVLVEGYKQLSFPKIEARSSLQETRQNLAGERSDIIALASADSSQSGLLPVFSPDDIDAIAGFILQTLKLKNE